MNKNVLLTGGNRGTGKAAVKKLAERGMTVTLTTARDRKKGDAVAAVSARRCPMRRSTVGRSTGSIRAHWRGRFCTATQAIKSAKDSGEARHPTATRLSKQSRLWRLSSRLTRRSDAIASH